MSSPAVGARGGTTAATPPVVAVVSPKGGTGKTTVAVNLAAALAAESPTVLMDLDLDNGNVEFALRLHPAHRLPDLVQRLVADNSVSPDMLLTESRDGLQVACAPDAPDHHGVSPRECAVVISRLAALAHPLVIDTAAGLNDYHYTAMRAATHVALVATTDVAAVRAGLRLVDGAVGEGIPVERIHLVINRADARHGLTTTDVERVLGLPLWLTIPEHLDLAATANLGAPLRSVDPHSPISRSFTTYAGMILHQEDPRCDSTAGART